MITYVCKTCGRALKSDVKPEFCYGCAAKYIENISDEDSKKMGLFAYSKGEETIIYLDGTTFANVVFEFPGDVDFNPFNGDHFLYFPREECVYLKDFQNHIIKSL
jgi:hypothetical protein